MFESLTEKLQNLFQQLGKKGRLTEADVTEATRQIRLALLEADVNYRVVKEFVNRIKERAVGQDVLWSSSGNSKGLSTEIFQDHDEDDWFIGKGFPAVRRSVDDYDPWFGDAVAYYANDKNPDEDDPALSDISNDRFRLRLYNSSAFTNDNYFLAQASYASDREFIEQYFRDEYQADPEPNNYMVLMHRGDQYTASVKVERHLSDFYETIDRLPELSLDVARTELFESPFYYEGKTSGGYMQRFNPTSTNYTAPAFLSDIPEYSDTNRTSLGRFDSMNMLYFSKKYFGFLNLTPRAGYRGTWYSKTKEDRHRVTETRYVNTNGIEVVRIVTNRFSIESGGDWRSLFELGAEASMKAFKVWETYPGDIPIGVVESVRRSPASMSSVVAYIKPFVDFERLDYVYVLRAGEK